MQTSKKTSVEGVSWIQNTTFYFESIWIFQFQPECETSACLPFYDLRPRSWFEAAGVRLILGSLRVPTDVLFERARGNKSCLTAPPRSL